MRWYLVAHYLAIIEDVLRRLSAKASSRQGKSPVHVSHFAIPLAPGRVLAFVSTIDVDFAHAVIRRDSYPNFGGIAQLRLPAMPTRRRSESCHRSHPDDRRLGAEPTYSAPEAAALLGRSYSWLDQRVRNDELGVHAPSPASSSWRESSCASAREAAALASQGRASRSDSVMACSASRGRGGRRGAGCGPE
jgi:hypothetical protein